MINLISCWNSVKRPHLKVFTTVYHHNYTVFLVLIYELKSNSVSSKNFFFSFLLAMSLSVDHLIFGPSIIYYLNILTVHHQQPLVKLFYFLGIKFYSFIISKSPNIITSTISFGSFRTCKTPFKNLKTFSSFWVIFTSMKSDKEFVYFRNHHHDHFTPLQEMLLNPNIITQLPYVSMTNGLQYCSRIWYHSSLKKKII